MTPIPNVPGRPLVGNIGDVDSRNIPGSLARLAKIYGPCFRLNFLGQPVVVVSSQDLLNAICNEKRFSKLPSIITYQLRNGIKDGLVTAFGNEANWGIAHRVLAPKFSPLALAELYPELHDIASQLVSKWARDPTKTIDPTDDFTRLTLDSIGLCAMGTRFNSFYRDSLHPFVSAMMFFLLESGERSTRPNFVSDYIYRASTRKYHESIEIMKSVALDAIEERRKNPSDKNDLLNAMLHGRDSKTGEKMSDENIINNAITFLIAGHETTSGLLSFLFVELLRNPAKMRKAQEEVDRVVGKEPITFEHTSKMPYITACLRETLRLWPTVPLITRGPSLENDTDYPMLIGKDQFEVNKNDRFLAVLGSTHRDPNVFGEDADIFKPERMLDESFRKLPPNSWKPFGSGMRACIGRDFAFLEAHIIIAMLLQNFEFKPDDPSYIMNIKTTLTIKPNNYTMHATLRGDVDPIALEHRLWGGKASEKLKHHEEAHVGKEKSSKPLSILYGSNTGTCEALAQVLASSASSRGYRPEVKTMDNGIEELKKDQPAVIITASFEGEPPDNAVQFVEWLHSESTTVKTKFAVFGCGNKEWANTYQLVPQLCNRLIAERGGQRIADFGCSDVSEGKFFDEFDSWADQKFWPSITKIYGDAGSSTSGFGLDVDLESGSRATDLRQDLSEGVVLENKVLTAEGEPEKKHIEIQLPSGLEYSAGDYLTILPVNHDTIVKQIMAHFQIPWDGHITIREGQHTSLPTGRKMPVYGLLSQYVELNLPCTQKDIAMLASCVEDENERKAIESISVEMIAEKRIRVWDIIERHPSCKLPFGDFLAMLKPLRVRQYSISSSPLVSPSSCTLTYGVLNQEAKIGGTRFLGSASNYLAELKPGDKVMVSVRKSHQAFHPPADVEKVPSIMICAGSGLAPFRGFVQERARQLEAGRTLAPALLFIGCRHPEKDALYSEQLQEWAKKGVVDVRYAFSRATDLSEGCRYVQHRLWRDRDDAKRLWEQGAKMYVCGNSELGNAIRDIYVDSSLEGQRAKGIDVTREEVEQAFAKLRNERYASDVFA